MDLKGKTILITGAANGIGACLTQQFLDKGSKVIACDIDKEALNSKFSSDSGCTTHQLDVREVTDWKVILQGLADLDIIINAAGVIRPNYLQEADDVSIHLQIDVNLKGTIFGTKYAAEVMRKRGAGHIINISSMASLAPVSGIGIYSASKFGVRGFSLAMAQELSEDGITVSVVAPDAVDTRMLDHQMNSEAAALTFSGSKILTADDVARVIFKEVIKGKKTEVWIPMNRGVQAYLGATFPKLAAILTKTLRKKGLKQQADFRRKRNNQ